MNLKKLMITAFLCAMLSCTVLTAQTVAISSPILEREGWQTPDYFPQNNEIMLVRETPKGVCIQKLDRKSLVEKSTTYLDEKRSEEYCFSVKFTNKYYAVFKEKSKKILRYYLQELDFQSGELMSSEIALLTKSNINVNGATIRFYDKQGKIVVSYPAGKQKKNELPVISYHVYNQEFTQVSESAIRMPYKQDGIHSYDFKMNARGELTDLVKVVDEKDDTKYHYELLKLNAEMTEVEGIPLQLPDIYKRGQLKMYYRENEIILAGYYNTSGIKEQKTGTPRKSATGIFAVRLDLKGKLVSEAAHEIPMEIYTQYAGLDAKDKEKLLKDKEKNELEYADLKLRNLNIEEDGSVLIIGEGHYQSVYVQNGSTVVNEGYKAILLAKLDPSGKMIWMKKIPKYQIADGGYIGGYLHLRKGKTHYFVFEDSDKNRNLKIEQGATTPNNENSWLAVVEFDEESGTMNRKYVLNFRNAKGNRLFKFQSDRMVVIGEGEFIFDVYKKDKEELLIKINLL